MNTLRKILPITFAILVSFFLISPDSLNAQGSEGFGQNKVQYNTHDWEVIETEHFLLHYYPEEKEMATLGAAMAERWYVRLSTLFDHQFNPPKLRVKISDGKTKRLEKISSNLFKVVGDSGNTLIEFKLNDGKVVQAVLENKRLGKIPLDPVDKKEVGDISRGNKNLLPGEKLKRFAGKYRRASESSPTMEVKFTEAEKKPIILYGSHPEFQQTNVIRQRLSEGTGGVTEALKDRLVMPIGPYPARFNQILGHEIVHVFQYDIAGFQGMRTMPLWFIEGMAEYLSTGEVDSQTHPWIIDAIANGSMMTIGEMNKNPGFLSYRYGQALWAYIGSSYGDYKVGKMFKYAAMGGGVNRTMKAVLGVSEDTLSAEWHNYLEENYTRNADRFKSPDSLDAFQRITNHLPTDDLVPKPGYLAPAVSPDGEKIAFLSNKGYDLRWFWDLYVAPADDATDARRLVKAGRSADFESLEMLTSAPTWTPDGERIVFVSQRKGENVLNVYSLESGDNRRIDIPSETIVEIRNPDVCSDGRRVVFSANEGGKSNLFAINMDGTELTRLTNDLHADLHPEWSPNCKRIAFSSDRGPETDFEDRVTTGNLRISILNMSTGTIEVLPRQAEGQNTNPTWSPDGEWVGFVSDRTGLPNIFLFNQNQKTLLQLTSFQKGVKSITEISPNLSWAKNENGKLAFSYFEHKGYNIYTTVKSPQDIAEQYNPQKADRLEIVNPTKKVLLSRRKVTRKKTKKGKVKTDTVYERFSVNADSALKLELTDENVTRVESENGPSVLELVSDKEHGLPDRAAFRNKEYDPGMEIDGFCRPSVGGSVGGTFNEGVGGSSCIRMSDLLGNKNMMAVVDMPGGNILHSSKAFWAWSNLKHRINYGFFASQFPIFRFIGQRIGTNENGLPLLETAILRDTYRSLGGHASYPLSTFERFDAYAAANIIRRDILSFASSASGQEKRTINLANVKFVTLGGSWVYDNSLPGFVHYLQGRRMKVGYQRMLGEWSSSSLNVDLRKYWHIDGRFSFATRLLASHKWGKNSEIFTTYWGRDYFMRGYSYGSFEPRECALSQVGVKERTLTGCPARDQLIGSSAMFANAELRFPILNPLDTGTPISIPPISGALFFDAGMAYNSLGELGLSRKPGQNPTLNRKPLMSFGPEIRVGVGRGLTLRFGRAWTVGRKFHNGGFFFSVFRPF